MINFKLNNWDSRNTFKHISSLTVSTLIPKLQTVDLPEIDGIIDFSTSNEKNRLMYESRTITISGIIQFFTKEDKQNKLYLLYNNVYNNPTGMMESSEFPNAKFKVRLNKIQEIGDFGNCSFRVILQYICEPFSYGITETVLNQDYTNSQKLTILNRGTAPTNTHKIILTAKSSIDGVLLETTTSQLSINEVMSSGDILEIDFSNYTAKINGLQIENTGWDGDFFELKQGGQGVDIAISGSYNIRWIVTYRYLLSDLSKINGGE